MDFTKFTPFSSYLREMKRGATSFALVLTEHEYHLRWFIHLLMDQGCQPILRRYSDQNKERAESLLGELLCSPFFPADSLVFHLDRPVEESFIERLNSWSDALDKSPIPFLLFGSPAMAKKIDQSCLTFDLSSIKGQRHLHFVREYALYSLQREGKTIRSQALEQLVHPFISFPEGLEKECEKIAIYLGERREVMVSDLEALLVPPEQTPPYLLYDCLMEKDWGAILNLHREFIQRGIHPLQQLALLRGQLKQTFRCLTVAVTASHHREMKRASLIGEIGLRDALTWLSEVELELKDSGGRESLIWERALFDLHSIFRGLSQGPS